MAVYPIASHCFFHTRDFTGLDLRNQLTPNYRMHLFVPISEFKTSFRASFVPYAPT